MSVQYFLLVYDRAAGRLLHEEVYDRRDDALEQRFVEERRHRSDMKIEIVVVGAASHDDLMRTHARYFLTLGELASPISRPA